MSSLFSINIITGTEMHANVEGVFAAGDVRTRACSRVATAVGDGVIAGFEAERYVAELEACQKQHLQMRQP